MELTNTSYFILGAFTLALGIIIKPYIDVLVMRIKRLFTRKNTQSIHNIDNINDDIADLQSQIDNLAEKLATRDRNRRTNLRRDVREYLTELKS